MSKFELFPDDVVFLSQFQRGYNMRGDGLLRRNDFIRWIDKQSNPVSIPSFKFRKIINDLFSLFNYLVPVILKMSRFLNIITDWGKMLILN